MNNYILNQNITGDTAVVNCYDDGTQKRCYDFTTDNYRLAQEYVFQLLKTIRDHRADITFTCDNNNINFVCKIDNEYLTHNAVKYP